MLTLKVDVTYSLADGRVRNKCVKYTYGQRDLNGPWAWWGCYGYSGDWPYPYGCVMTADARVILHDGREEPVWAGAIPTTTDADFARDYTLKTGKLDGRALVAAVRFRKTKARGDMKITAVNFDLTAHPAMEEYREAFEANERRQKQEAAQAAQANRRKRAREEADRFWEKAQECADTLEVLGGQAKRLMAAKAAAASANATEEEEEQVMSDALEEYSKLGKLVVKLYMRM
jgi:hypothetical protein